MIKINVPVNNSVDFLIGDIYVHTTISFNPQFPPITTEGKITLDTLNTKLNEIGHRLASKISLEVEKELKDKQEGGVDE